MWVYCIYLNVNDIVIYNIYLLTRITISHYNYIILSEILIIAKNYKILHLVKLLVFNVSFSILLVTYPFLAAAFGLSARFLNFIIFTYCYILNTALCLSVSKMKNLFHVKTVQVEMLKAILLYSSFFEVDCIKY